MDLEDRLISNILVLMEPVASESNKHVNKEKIHIYNSAKNVMWMGNVRNMHWWNSKSLSVEFTLNLNYKKQK